MSTSVNGNGIMRFNRGRVCPVCGGSDSDPRGAGQRCHGFLSSDGKKVFCSREEHAGQARYDPGSETYIHDARGPCKCGQEHGAAEPIRVYRPRRQVDRVYNYIDADGKVRHKTIRYKNPKSFSQCRPGPDGKDVYSLKGVELILFHLPEILAFKTETVWVVEGEKDAEALGTLGLVATCNPMGAKKWRDSYSDMLRGRHVVILPDNDDDGRQHAQQVAQSLQGKAASVKIVELPGVPEKGDVSDFLASGGTVDQLQDLARSWKPPAPPAPAKPTTDSSPLDARLARRPKTDTGNAERMVARFGDLIRHCHPWKKWLFYDGQRWVLDDPASIHQAAKKTARKILAEAATIENDAKRGALVKWARHTEGRSRLSSMIALAAVEEGIPILPDVLDSDPWLLNVRNGTINLRTGELRTHRREDFITMMGPVDFDPRAKCPLWNSVLLRVFDGNADLIAFWDRLCGISLTGVTHEQILPILWGKGSNGKSTVVKTLVNLMGPDFAMIAPPGLLMAKRGEAHPTERAKLHGKRLVVEMETEEGIRLNENLVKHLTGGDPITARRMNEDFWSFNPTHKLMLCTNHMPEIRGTDHAIWRRPKLVPFTVTIPESEAIVDLTDRLRDEFPGILARCVRGCLDWQRNGLGVPGEVTQATEGYRAEQDTLGVFLAEHCMLADQLRSKASHLYGRYRSVTEGMGETPMTQTRFGITLRDRGFERIQNNGTWYLGIGLRSDSWADSRDPY